MGRKREQNLTLPPRMRVRTMAGGRVLYYYDNRPNLPGSIPLGGDRALAVKRWGELEGGRWSDPTALATFRQVGERYMREVVPGKAPRTQRDNAAEFARLLLYFDDPPVPLEQIEPKHVRGYLDWRAQQGAPIRANREKALLSSMYNFGREKGYTDKANPCAGVKGAPERGRRDVEIDDAAIAAVYEKACQPLRDAMDLHDLTGQRPADVRKFDERDVRDGFLHVRQGKTGAALRIEIMPGGELDQLLRRIAERKRGYVVRSTALLVNENGHRLTYHALRSRFDKARAAAGVAKAKFQLRDLRARAGTDKADAAGDARQAQRLLGHSSVTTTEIYLRNRRGAKVTPTR